MSARATSFDLAVVGAGPAGLATAVAARDAGMTVAVIDEQPAPGGQIYRNVENAAAGGPVAELLGADYLRGLELVRRFRAASCDYLAGTRVWDIPEPGVLAVASDGGSRLVRTGRVVLATGAQERPTPIRGWTLPGVMTVGAAQTLLKTSAAVPDGPFVIAGSGPLLLVAALQLARAGAAPEHVLSTETWRNRLAAARHWTGAAQSLGAIGKGLGWLAELRRLGVAVQSGVEDIRAHGEGRLSSVTWRRHGRHHETSADHLFLHQGVVPVTQLTAVAGCDLAWDDRQLCWAPRTDRWGATAVPAVAVVGDGAGIGGALAAEHAGTLCGLDAARRAGRIGESDRDAAAAAAGRQLMRELAIRPFLDALYRPPPDILAPGDDDRVLCRCEEVTAGTIRELVAAGCPGPNQMKAFTRCGMGACQGRQCALPVSGVIARATGRPMAEIGSYTVRPPVKPVTLGEVAALDGVDREVAAVSGLFEPK